MEFDQFIAIPVNFPFHLSLRRWEMRTLISLNDVPQGCTKGQHTSAPAKQPATTTTTTITTASPPTVAPTTTTNGVETYGVPSSTTTSTPSITPARTPAPTAASTTPKEKPEERDEDGFVVEKGMRCRRRACGYVASGDGQADRGECRYHPGAVSFWSHLVVQLEAFADFALISLPADISRRIQRLSLLQTPRPRFRRFSIHARMSDRRSLSPVLCPAQG
jgi:hypothetical protein